MDWVLTGWVLAILVTGAAIGIFIESGVPASHWLNRWFGTDLRDRRDQGGSGWYDADDGSCGGDGD